MKFGIMKLPSLKRALKMNELVWFVDCLIGIGCSSSITKAKILSGITSVKQNFD